MLPHDRKKLLRRELRLRLSQASTDERTYSGTLAAERLLASPFLQGRGALLAFVSHGGEMDTEPLLRAWLAAGRTLFLPRVTSDAVALEVWRMPGSLQMMEGYKGYHEPNPSRCFPAAPQEVDAVLVPGLAFDTAGTRLGQGKGHYDRLLAHVPHGLPRIAWGYDWQVRDASVEPLPREEHDQLMTAIATPQRIVEVT